MIEFLLFIAAGVLGWFLARRQKPTEPPVTPPKKYEPPPKYEDKIDEITKSNPYPDSDSDLAAWLDDNAGGGRK